MKTPRHTLTMPANRGSRYLLVQSGATSALRERKEHAHDHHPADRADPEDCDVEKTETGDGIAATTNRLAPHCQPTVHHPNE